MPTKMWYGFLFGKWHGLPSFLGIKIREVPIGIGKGARLFIMLLLGGFLVATSGDVVHLWFFPFFEDLFICPSL